MSATTAVDVDLLATFVAVAEEASFSKAARRLGVTKGTVSRAIRRLEVRLGAELLHRTTHTVALSTAGTALYERTATHLRALVEGIGTLPERAEEPAGLLRLTAPHDVGTILLPELIAQFGVRYPAVRFDLHLTNTRVDLVAERFDLAIRAYGGSLRDSTLTVRKLGRTAFGLFAAPSYLARRGLPRALGDPKHDWVAMPVMARALFHAARDFRPRVLANDILAMRALLRQGLGVGALPRYVADDAIADGSLVQVLPHEQVLKALGLAIVYPSSGTVPRKVAAFRDFLAAQLGARRLEPA